MDKVLDLLKVNNFLTFTDILRKTKYKKYELDKKLLSLIKDNKIIKHKNNYYYLYTGIVKKTSNSEVIIYEFNNKQEKIKISYECSNFYNDDEVVFRIYNKTRKLKVAYIVYTKKHNLTHIVAKAIIKDDKYYLEAINNEDFVLKTDEKLDLNKVYSVKIDYKNNKAYDILVLGDNNDPGIDIKTIAYTFGFEYEFSDSVNEEVASSIPSVVNESDLKNRVDFTNDLVITIDGDDSKDFDDAISLKVINNKYYLNVHIADVSHYVKYNSNLDKEAYKRGTSVYLANKVLPMLPFELSNGICSLNEGEIRLTMSCLMEFDNKGKLLSSSIKEGYIKSTHRMTYNNVNKIYDGDEKLITKYSDIYNMLVDMKKLSILLRNERNRLYALNFNTKEYKFKLDDNYNPVDVYEVKKGFAQDMIEDFMVKANEVVAMTMQNNKIPAIYRIHEKPEDEKVIEAFGIIKNMHKDIKVNSISDKKDLFNLLEEINNKYDDYFANYLLLRSMKKAKYENECLGHYGLSLKYYTHFTSPIRRYPDLILHRIIKELYFKQGIKYENFYKKNLKDIANRCSIQEKKSVDCERMVNDFLYSKLHENDINKEFMATISSVVPYGFFVELEDGCSGLVHLSSLIGNYFYNESNQSIVSLDDKNKKYFSGLKVCVKLIKSDTITKKIDFVLKD